MNNAGRKTIYAAVWAMLMLLVCDLFRDFSVFAVKKVLKKLVPARI